MGNDWGDDDVDDINGVGENKKYIQLSLQRDKDGQWPMVEGCWPKADASGWRNGWMEGLTDRWMDRWIDGWMDE